MSLKEAPFIKYDQEKDRWDLLPWLAVSQVVKVLTFGAQKYAPNNWRGCSDEGKFMGACMRHISAHACGELYDPETGLLHLSQAVCNLLFIIETFYMVKNND